LNRSRADFFFSGGRFKVEESLNASAHVGLNRK
jgi:hypothetical protein